MKYKTMKGDMKMSYQINIFNMDINYCSKDGNVNVNRPINKNNSSKDKDHNSNNLTANNQK